MFNKLSNILQHAVEALAPDTPLHEDFVYHWKSVTNFYIENNDDKTPVSESNIPSHLKQVVGILLQEEESRDAGDTGPCMEYLLQHKILETLFTLGKADCPPGMKQQVLIFFKHILGRIKQPLLPHVNVHRPVINLVQLCGEVRAGPTETEEVNFLCTVCARLKRQPHLTNFFITNNKQEGAKEHNLVNSLINLSKSEDGRVAVKSCEGLLLLVSMPSAKIVVQDTQFCTLLNDRLSHLFTSMPASLSPSDVESLQAKWGLDAHSYDASNFRGKRSVVSFLSWFDYCDTIIMEAPHECGEHIAKMTMEKFFKKTVAGPLMQTDEQAVLTATSVLTKLICMVRSKQLLVAIVDFLIPPASDDTENDKLLMRLLERCDHISDELSIVTLRLFECLLSKPCSLPLDRLVLRYLEGRGYHAKNPGNIVAESEELEWDLEPGLDQRQAHNKLQEESNESAEDAGGDSPKMRIQRTVQRFLNVLPDSAKSSQVQDDDSGYDSYLREAHRSYKEICQLCSKFEWPDISSLKNEPAERNAAVAEFDQGPFLTMLFGKIGGMLSQPYNVNLVVTSIASRLTLLPHPNSHEMFTDSLTPMRPKTKSLYSAIQSLSEQVLQRICHVTNFKSKLVAARRHLTVGGNNDDNKASKNKGAAASVNYNEDHKTFLEGVIVVEEFCKELAAIAFVKHHSTQGGDKHT